MATTELYNLEQTFTAIWNNGTGREIMEQPVTAIWNNDTSPEIKLMEDYLEYKISWKIFQVYVPICTFFGICGNTMSFLVLMFSNLRHTSTCIYMATISCLDTVILSVVLCYHVNRYPGVNVFHSWTCSVITFLFYFSIHFDTLLLLAMTAERYIVVRFPLKAASITRKKTLMIIAGIGTFSLALNLHIFFTRGMNEVDGRSFCGYTGEMEKYFVTKVYPWIDSTIYCFIPMSSLFILNILIISNIRKAGKIQKKMVANGNGVSTGRGNGENKGQKQVTLMLVLVSVAFLLLAGPIAILIITQRYLWIPKTPYDRALNWLAHSFTDNLMYTNHAINFVLYLVSGQRFRGEVKRVFCGRGRKYTASSSTQRPTDQSFVTETSSQLSQSNVPVSIPLE